MFEKFTKAAREVVTAAEGEAREAGDRRIEPIHLLSALASASATARLLEGRGVTSDRLREAVAASGGGLDGAVLASVGIDLDEVREQAEATFGEGALERAGRSRGHLRFAPESKDALRHALRVAAAGPGREIGATHILAGVLDQDDERTAGVLRVVCDDLAGLRADVLRVVGDEAA